MASFASLSLKMSKLIFMWAPVSLHHLTCWECQEPSDLSSSDDTNEAVNTELLSLSNLQSGEGECGQGDISPWSLPCQSLPWPLCSLWGDGWWSKLVSLGWSFLGRISWTVESEWLKGWRMQAWSPWPSCLYLGFKDGLGDYSLTFLYS